MIILLWGFFTKCRQLLHRQGAYNGVIRYRCAALTASLSPNRTADSGHPWPSLALCSGLCRKEGLTALNTWLWCLMPCVLEYTPVACCAYARNRVLAAALPHPGLQLLSDEAQRTAPHNV